jgi:hypothetical protein
MPKAASPRNRRKSAHHKAKLRAKHTKQRLRATRQLAKRKNGGRLRR